MITFTDKRLYVKGTCSAILTDKTTGDIVYFSDKFQTGNMTTSVTTGEIRAGLGNGIATIIPSDSALNVEFAAADFSLFAKMAQVGGTLNYNAPAMTCQIVEATGDTLTIDVTGGAPVAQLGFSDVFCYVQEVGAASPIATYGQSYPISATGEITGFTATSGTKLSLLTPNTTTSKKQAIKNHRLFTNQGTNPKNKYHTSRIRGSSLAITVSSLP